VYWGVPTGAGDKACTGGSDPDRGSGSDRLGVVFPLVYGVEYALGKAGAVWATGGEPALPGGVLATGLMAYGELAYGDSGCEGDPSVRTRLLGGRAKADCAATGEGECCAGEKARGGACGGTCGCGCAITASLCCRCTAIHRL
jgi:hypothetical protein